MDDNSDLTELMGTYLSIDYRYIAPDPWDVVRTFAQTEGLRVVVGATAEARELLSRHLNDEELWGVLEREHRLGYVPRLGGYSTNDWLTQVADLLDRMVRQRRAGN